MRHTIFEGLAVVLVVVLVVGACATEPSTEAEARFAGEWMIDQPTHATYEASWYRFHADGELEHLRDCAFGGPVPTGFVNLPDDSVRCELAAAWSAPDRETLVIDATCSDGVGREVVLGFPADATGNATGQSAIDVVAVDGDGGWGHTPFDWVWQKCGEAGCMPVFDACR
jgi:hypothetical protein